MKFKQLTAANRGAIEALLNEKYTQKEVARVLRVNPGTVSREIKRGSTPKGYIAWIAQLRSERLK